MACSRPYNYEEDDVFIMQECYDDAKAYALNRDYEMVLVPDDFGKWCTIFVQHKAFGIVEGITFTEMGVLQRFTKK